MEWTTLVISGTTYMYVRNGGKVLAVIKNGISIMLHFNGESHNTMRKDENF